MDAELLINSKFPSNWFSFPGASNKFQTANDWRCISSIQTLSVHHALRKIILIYTKNMGHLSLSVENSEDDHYYHFLEFKIRKAICCHHSFFPPSAHSLCFRTLPSPPVAISKHSRFRRDYAKQRFATNFCSITSYSGKNFMLHRCGGACGHSGFTLLLLELCLLLWILSFTAFQGSYRNCMLNKSTKLERLCVEDAPCSRFLSRKDFFTVDSACTFHGSHYSSEVRWK